MKQRGYCATNAGLFARRFLERLEATNAGTRAACIGDISAELKHHLSSVGPLRQFERCMADFFVSARFVAADTFESVGHLGLARATVATAPASFRAALELLLTTLVEERSYRLSVGDRVSSERNLYYHLKLLADWAHWLESQGIGTWQELTAVRFRQRMLEIGRARRPHAMCHHFGRLATFLDFLKGQRRLFKNPLSIRGKPRTPELMQRAVSDAAVRQWLIAIRGHHEPAVRTIAALVVLHGLSFGEIRRLRLVDYQRRRRALHIGRRHLTIELDPVTSDAIDAYLKTRPVTKVNSYLLVNQRSRLRDGPSCSSFISEKVHALGIGSRAARQRLMRSMALHDGAVVTARYFKTEVKVVNNHSAQQLSLFRKPNHASTAAAQQNL